MTAQAAAAGTNSNEDIEAHVDVLIVGAGLSGIGAAWHLQQKCPGKSYAILEGREAIGGTWDLFRYPGIRSDSDMYTLGYRFKPWTEAKAIADGPRILNYVRETANDNGIDSRIRFSHRVKSASWSSRDARWTVEAERGPSREPVRFTCGFLFMCSGYYNYENGYEPEFPGADNFRGRIVHPQKWTDDIDYAGKRVVVIGSGATAVTLVPEMAKTAAHVTMLQRSPTYVVSRPAQDALANRLREKLPAKLAYHLIRWRNVLFGMYFFQLCRRRPDVAKKMILGAARKQLPADYDFATHFTPRYNPWEQRLCLVPDGDLFNAISDGRASVVTNAIDTFTEKGIRLKDGSELEADLIVTATGLNLQVLGGMQVSVDGRAVDFARTLNYKGMMFSDVPNMASIFGYINASWTLRSDLTSEYVCRLLNYMDRHGYKQCTPHNADPAVGMKPWVDFSSGYLARSNEKMPKQGTRAPWKLTQNYARDIFALRLGRVDDGVMVYE
jgi:cation diffusion facilitator CzcD-associated flavoprotein CzcO